MRGIKLRVDVNESLEDRMDRFRGRLTDSRLSRILKTTERWRKMMNMVDCKMTEFALMGVEPKVENAIAMVMNDIVKSYAFMRMTDATLESIKDDILKECGSHISELTLEPIACEGVIEIMFKMAGRTICVKCFSPGSERWLSKLPSVPEDK